MNAEIMPLVIALTSCFLLVMAVLWFLLPFAIFGIKDLLRDILHELRERKP